VSDATTVLRPEVVIVGAGPSGLTAARWLAPRLRGDVLVVDREQVAGGIPRHSDHLGYGLRDLRRVMTGPAYARRLAADAAAAGAVIRIGTTVTGWSGDLSLEATAPQGRLRIDASAVVLATGARERPRAARLVPGDRPSGIYTTGQLQDHVHLRHGPVGRAAVVVGAELVSWSAVLTLRRAGCRTVLMTTEQPSPESSGALDVVGRSLFRTPVATSTRVVRIIGHQRLCAVETEDLVSGRRRTVACDTLIFTGDWIPDHELARLSGIDIDPGTRGPSVDTTLQSSRPGVFAIGNLVHPVDTADVAALDGRHVGPFVLEWIQHRRPADWDLEIVAGHPFRWVSPNRLRPHDPPPARRRLILWPDQPVATPQVTASQDGRVVATRTLPWPASPGRAFRVPWSLLASIDPDGGPVTVGATRRFGRGSSGPAGDGRDAGPGWRRANGDGRMVKGSMVKGSMVKGSMVKGR
jgi:thioredoxin reductase